MAPNPHVYTVRTMCTYIRGPGLPAADLVWYGAAGDRTKESISGFGILDDDRGILVRDDYGGYTSYDDDLAGVQQCLAHLWRHLDDVHAIDPDTQVWTRQATDALHTANETVNTARAAGKALDPERLKALRHDYDQAVAVGISTNLSRRWHKGKHPGLVLAQRLQRKADQVWLFTTRFDVPATNNGSEHAIRGYKIAAQVSGCWRTLQRHCRIRSYLDSARNHARHPLDAIRDALTNHPWMPPHNSATATIAARSISPHPVTAYPPLPRLITEDGRGSTVDRGAPGPRTGPPGPALPVESPPHPSGPLRRPGRDRLF